MQRAPVFVRNLAKDCQQTNNASPLSSATSRSMQVKHPDISRNIIQNSDIVCFDVDSTVIMEEGIDELAAFCGKGSEVARVTRQAMGGSMTFQEALRIRLDIIRPSFQQICDFVKQRPCTLTKGVKRFISYLQASEKQVFLISGGFHYIIDPVAVQLGIPTSNVFANVLQYYNDGEYAGFDTAQPTSRTGGKSEAIAIIKRNNPISLITMIGDGATDLEAVPPADFFIGFGGNIVRPEVFNKAQCFVTDFDTLMPRSFCKK